MSTIRDQLNQSRKLQQEEVREPPKRSSRPQDSLKSQFVDSSLEEVPSSYQQDMEKYRKSNALFGPKKFYRKNPNFNENEFEQERIKMSNNVIYSRRTKGVRDPSKNRDDSSVIENEFANKDKVNDKSVGNDIKPKGASSKKRGSTIA